MAKITFCGIFKMGDRASVESTEICSAKNDPSKNGSTRIGVAKNGSTRIGVAGRYGLVAKFIVLTAASFGLAACFGSTEEVHFSEAHEDRTATEIYASGLDLVEKTSFKDAAEEFEALDRHFPHSDVAEKGMVMAVFSHFEAKDYLAVERLATRFIREFGQNEQADYVNFLLGEAVMAEFPAVQWDQTQVRRALRIYSQLVNRYPDSKYAEIAKDRIALARDQLAGKEMSVGRFYSERGDVHAAVNRFLNVVRFYDNTRHVEEALLRLTETYLRLGLIPEARGYAALLGKNFPDSEWYLLAFNLLEDQQLSPLLDPDSDINQLVPAANS